MANKLIKLTKQDGSPVLIGVEHIIDVNETMFKDRSKTPYTEIKCSEIQSGGALVTTNYVLETLDEIYNLTKE